MTARFTRATVIELLLGDEELLHQAFEVGLLPREREAYLADEISDLLVARVEVILRMRGEILATRRQIVKLLELLSSRERP